MLTFYKKRLHTWLVRRASPWRDRRFVASLTRGILFLSVSFILNYLAGTYATMQASSPVKDFFLDHLPVLLIKPLFVQGFVLFLFLGATALFLYPRFAPFTIKALGLFITIRSFFIILTHIGPAYEHVALLMNPILNKFTFGGDLFFSAHTGLPFLMMFIFWKKKIWRVFFFVCSIVFGATVLLGHIHYSIDVFGAFFITYAIFHLAELFFARDFLDLQRKSSWLFYATRYLFMSKERR